jgi:16S rRNA (guanine527-N7)-methyltransferase
MKTLAELAFQYLKISLSEDQIRAFDIYLQELISWNKNINLTAISEPQDIILKHFLDSLSCTLASNFSKVGNLIDIGTGAGFPGTPLKIVYSQLYLTLVDSVGKKTEFCKFIVNLLALDKVKVINSRAEELGQNTDYREKYDLAVGRAVSGLSTLSEYLLPFLKVGGKAIIQKGRSAKDEAHSANRAITEMGGKMDEIRPIQIPGLDERYLISLSKISPTPSKYPRRNGMPSKKPLN